MRKVISLLFLLYCAFTAAAQYNLPPVYELTNDTAAAYTIGSSFTQLLDDPQKQWNIDEVSRPPVNRLFHINETGQKGINYRIHTYWVRFTIRNTVNHEVKLYFSNEFGEGDFSFEYVNLYVRGNNKWNEEKTDNVVHWSHRAEAKFFEILPVTLQPQQEQTVYLRLHDSFLHFNPKNIDVHFQTAIPLYKQAYEQWVERTTFRNNFINALLLGIFIAAIFFNIYNYILIRERAYLYYIFFLFFYLLGKLGQFAFLLAPEHPEFFYWGRRIFWIFVNGFLVLFVREFLKTRITAPLWDKLLLIAAAFQVVYLAILWSVAPQLSFKVNLALQYGVLATYEAVIFTIALTLIYLYRKRYQPAKFLLITLAPFTILLSLVEFVFFVLNNILILFTGSEVLVSPIANKFLFYGENITILWMVVFFSGALTQRYTQARKALAGQALEKERLQKEKEIEKGHLIAQQKIELEKQVEQRTAELKQSIEELKTTQAQLIQKEKMASLGELTAGIAHEIQNPLNFVINFSEVSTELVEEQKQYLAEDNKEEAVMISGEVKNNLHKVLFHGRRADAIVKSMLEHSRTSRGEKQLTDVNALVDEYLRLSYHGFRAKDKNFQATIQTYFDEHTGKLNIVPQDLGRVLLNLFNNALYAVHEKKRQLNGPYEPLITVSTTKIRNQVNITVRDNGNGIPHHIIDKIFQPFFTTKPTGEGTGLGLSLSYDIITKDYNGSLKVNTEEGKFVEFRIILPVKEATDISMYNSTASA